MIINKKQMKILSVIFFLILSFNIIYQPNIFKRIFVLGIDYHPTRDNNLKIEINPIISYNVAINRTNELYLIFNAEDNFKNVLKLLHSNSQYEWNYTAEKIISGNSSFSLYDVPSLITTNNSLLVVNSYRNNESYGILMLTREFNELNWNYKVITQNNTFRFKDPMIKSYLNSENDFSLSWLDNREGFYNLYSMNFSASQINWTNTKKISFYSGLNCSNYDFFIDSEGSTHYVWAQGLKNHEQILYRKVYQNNSMSVIDNLTNGFNSCLEPKIIIDLENNINVFWSNYTVENPGLQYGTQNIQKVKKPALGNWSKPLEVAPYIPVERPPSGESDARKPTIAIDKQGVLWLAHEIREQYAYHQGIDIRSRLYGTWQPSFQLSLYNNPAINPLIKCDNLGNLHCFWMDLRSSYYEIYYRVKYFNDVWSKEYNLIKFQVPSNTLLILIIISSVLVLLSIPVLVFRTIIRKRDEKKYKQKLSQLQD